RMAQLVGDGKDVENVVLIIEQHVGMDAVDRPHISARHFSLAFRKRRSIPHGNRRRGPLGTPRPKAQGPPSRSVSPLRKAPGTLRPAPAARRGRTFEARPAPTPACAAAGTGGAPAKPPGPRRSAART